MNLRIIMYRKRFNLSFWCLSIELVFCVYHQRICRNNASFFWGFCFGWWKARQKTKKSLFLFLLFFRHTPDFWHASSIYKISGSFIYPDGIIQNTSDNPSFSVLQIHTISSVVTPNQKRVAIANMLFLTSERKCKFNTL